MIKTFIKKKSFKIKSIRTNWNAFTENLKNNFEIFLQNDFISAPTDKKYELFTDIVINCLKDSTPNKKSVSLSKHKNPVPWWDEECNKLVRLRKASYRKWNFSKLIKDRIAYNKINCLLVKTFKYKKGEFQKICRINKFSN